MQTIPTLVADFETNFAAPVSAGATSATLASVLDDDGNPLFSGVYGLTVDIGNATKEYVICTLSGTTISNVQSISRQGEVNAGFTYAHRRGAVIAITDWVAIYRIASLLNGSTGFDSNSPVGYDGTPSSLSGNQFATVAYVLSVVTGGTVTFDQQVVGSELAGETIAPRSPVYLKESDGRWYNVKTSDTTTFLNLKRGIALNAATVGGAITIGISGPVSGFSSLTTGAEYFATDAGGSISTTPGTNSVFMGWALSATRLLVSPFDKTIPSQKEKDAMAGGGIFGTPSSINQFVTIQGTSAGNTDQQQINQDTPIIFGSANSSGNRFKIAQSFIPTRNSIKSVDLYRNANTGTYTGNVTVSIQADTAGAPSGTMLTSKTISNAIWNVYNVGDFLVLFANEINVTLGSTYWIVVESSTGDAANHPNLGMNSGGGYANGGVKYNNTTDGWVAISTIDLYFKVNEGFAGKAVSGSSTGFISPIVNGNNPTKNGVIANTASSVTTIAHSLGKIPRFIDFSFISASSGGNGSFGTGTYDVASNTYASAYGTGANTGNPAFNVNSTSSIVTGGNNSSGILANLTVTYIDENIVTFTNSGTGFAGGGIVYKIVG